MSREENVPTPAEVQTLEAMGFKWRNVHRLFALRTPDCDPKHPSSSRLGWIHAPHSRDNPTDLWGVELAHRDIPWHDDRLDFAATFPDPVTAATWLLIEASNL